MIIQYFNILSELLSKSIMNKYIKLSQKSDELN